MRLGSDPDRADRSLPRVRASTFKYPVGAWKASGGHWPGQQLPMTDTAHARGELPMDDQDRLILLVDDDEGDIELIRWAFANSGLDAELAVARDGLEALDLLLPSHGRKALQPAMVLMDVDMPRMGGVETVRRLRAAPSTRILPVIMLTCSVAERDIVASNDVGANGYVQKPLNIGDFLASVSVLGTFWLDLHRTQGTPGRPGRPGRSGLPNLHAVGPADAVGTIETGGAVSILGPAEPLAGADMLGVGTAIDLARSTNSGPRPGPGPGDSSCV